MTLDYEILSAFVLATALLSISPGPDIIYVITQSIANGKKHGLATTAGLMTGCLVHTTLLAFGLSALIRNNHYVFLIIKVIGAIYLFYLAWITYRGGDSIRLGTSDMPKMELGTLFRRGFIMNVLNPKVTVFFLAFFPGFLFSDDLGLVLQFYILGALFILVSSAVFSLAAVLSGSISGYIRRREHPGRGLKWLQIIVYSAIALYLILSDN